MIVQPVFVHYASCGLAGSPVFVHPVFLLAGYTVFVNPVSLVLSGRGGYSYEIYEIIS